MATMVACHFYAFSPSTIHPYSSSSFNTSPCGSLNLKRGHKNASLCRNRIEKKLRLKAKAEEEERGSELDRKEKEAPPQRLYASRGLTREGPAQGGRWMSSTTRHVRLYMGYIDPVTLHMDQQQIDKLTLILDPDNEFVWPEDKCQKVYDYLKELVDNYAGALLTEYTLRLIGSDIEHYIRKLLLAGEIKYNLDCRVLNFSMGKPRVDPEQLLQQAEQT
ncbi:hypothetical protein O6H91_03G093100 [Diphasiastrum complanatum]|uniref:Uncharacterized protein n=2 Tax=Diphasiastrum complanatum TaxID=34168 RepID=A0ACC2E9F9_DIPCM|nr:hypothetical protein O6H91_03G065900 [Diphasiastrum complanatum]KAJ7563018.1 hypothetical protein O6H91_03G093100 [Diphasiastrum complanatum]